MNPIFPPMPFGRNFRKSFSLAAAVSMFSLASIQAQPFTPRIGYAYPAGGRQGTTVEVRLGGQFLDGATNVYVSGGGVRATVLEHIKPLTPQQFNNLREKLKELQDKRQEIMRSRRQGGSATNLTWTVADERQFSEIRKKIATFQRRPANPAIAETVRLQVTFEANAQPGQRELRLAAAQGLSNPLVFCVGQLPEASKPQPSLEAPPFRRPLRINNEVRAVPPTEMSVSLPVVVNGQILQGGVDRYRFQARKGQHLLLAVSARELIPYLADAVPGWFQATLTLKDAKGRELAYDDDFRFHPDPVLYYEIPTDGEYIAEIKDAIYRGREDFVYRITIGELPFITGLFPLGGRVDMPTTIELSGWNLPKTNITETEKVAGLCLLAVSREERISNPAHFLVDVLPETLEQEPNDTAPSANTVTLPVIINGRVQKPGDWDVFKFEGRAGERVVAEVYARRLDSPLDSVLKLTDAAGRQLAYNDDYEDKGCGLDTHYADSYLSVTLPSDGTYYVHLGDVQHQGGAEFAYRLRLSEPRPDFELRVVPSSINVRAGACVPLTVYALRKDGFTNEITLALDDAPAGFSLGGGRIPANCDQVRVTLSAPAVPPREAISLSLQGRAIAGRQQLLHPAVPAEDMMQAFAYRHLVPAKELRVMVVGNGRFLARAPMRLLEDKPAKIPTGGTARVRVSGPPALFSERLQLELSEAPEGIALKEVSPSRDGAELVLAGDAAKAKPGLKGNLIVNLVAATAPAQAQKAKKQGNQRRAVLGTLPAIPFEVVAGDR